MIEDLVRRDQGKELQSDANFFRIRETAGEAALAILMTDVFWLKVSTDVILKKLGGRCRMRTAYSVVETSRYEFL